MASPWNTRSPSRTHPFGGRSIATAGSLRLSFAMTLLHASSIGLAFGSRTILDRLTLTIEEGERVGLVGVNGSGKSSLLRILARAAEPDRGEVQLRRGASVTYLPQEPEFPRWGHGGLRARGGAGAAPPGHRGPRRALRPARSRAGPGAARPSARRACRPVRPDRAPGRMGHLARGPPTPRPARREGMGPAGGGAVGGCKEAGGHRPGASLSPRPPAPRRAHQPPRRRHGGLAGGGAGRTGRRARSGDPRPLFPRRPGRPDGGDHAGWQRPELARKLRGLPGAEAARRGAGRARPAQAGAMDLAGGGLAATRRRGPPDEEQGPDPAGARAHGREGLRAPGGGRPSSGASSAALPGGPGSARAREGLRGAQGTHRGGLHPAAGRAGRDRRAQRRRKDHLPPPAPRRARAGCGASGGGRPDAHRLPRPAAGGARPGEDRLRGSRRGGSRHGGGGLRPDRRTPAGTPRVSRGPALPADDAAHEGEGALRRREEPAAARATLPRGGERSGPRRADERPRPRHAQRAGAAAPGFRGERAARDPRPLLPRQGRDLHPGLRGGGARGALSGQLRDLPDAQGAVPGIGAASTGERASRGDGNPPPARSAPASPGASPSRSSARSRGWRRPSSPPRSARPPSR